MKKIITGALAITVLSTIVMAETNDFYIGGGIVYEKIDGSDDMGQALELHVGKEIANNFGAELRISKTFNEAKYEGNYYWDQVNYVSGTIKVDVTTVGVFGTYTYSPISELSIVPKVGLNYVNSKLKYASGTATKDISNSESGLAYGIDLKYNITPNFSSSIGYTRVAVDVQHITVGLERRF